jgi:hypothetical protein
MKQVVHLSLPKTRQAFKNTPFTEEKVASMLQSEVDEVRKSIDKERDENVRDLAEMLRGGVLPKSAGPKPPERSE